ncbi:carbohydrate sulfotransferase 1-like [Clytia hemisphaerica]|uniref:Sulfotransferase domain-containing protein n=1 Tax=Clytia hemisphaerica TaxID=252671 RepID=A0A7M5WJF6_9CNID
MRIQCLCLLVCCVVLYTIVMVTYLQSYIKQNKKKYNFLPPKLIVLVSQPRSGSTFLGNVISKSIKSVYFYEPLYKYDTAFKIDINFADQKERADYDPMSGEYLRKVFACDFNDQQSWHRIFESPFKVLSSNECQDENAKQGRHDGKGGGVEGYKLNRCLPYFNSNQIQKNCQRMNLMVKLLEPRIPFSDVKQLQNLLDYRAKYRVVYLIRDPRAAFLSLLKTGWVAKNHSGPGFTRYVEMRCNEMERNMRDVKELKNVITVRYEDIIVKPSKTLRQLYDFLGDEDSKEIQKPLNSQPCYVPKSNVIETNSSQFTSRKLNHKVQKYWNGQDDPPQILSEDQEKFGDYLSHFTSRKLQYKLQKVPDDQDKKEEDYLDQENYDERHFIRKTEIDRQNYRCYALNKWRYEVKSDFIDLVESKCEKMMGLGGYLKSNGDKNTLLDVTKKLIKPDF